jgi:hypothetical protein
MAISVVALVLVMAMATAMLPTGVLWLLTHGEEIGERARAIGRRCRLLRPAPVVTYDPPIERIAADLRRLSRQRRQQHSGTSAARRRGLQMAYDGTLVAACRALDVPHLLDELAEGMDRDFERVRIESALEAAGLRFRSAIR